MDGGWGEDVGLLQTKKPTKWTQPSSKHRHAPCQLYWERGMAEAALWHGGDNSLAWKYSVQTFSHVCISTNMPDHQYTTSLHDACSVHTHSLLRYRWPLLPLWLHAPHWTCTIHRHRSRWLHHKPDSCACSRDYSLYGHRYSIPVPTHQYAVHPSSCTWYW